MRVGFVGLGAMGLGMASRLAAAGHELRALGHRRRAPLERLLAEGAVEAPDAAALARESEVVFLCLPDSAAVAQVVDAMGDGLGAGRILVDAGTSSLTATEALAQRLAARGVGFAEAPLTGGTVQAEEGKLGALVGASPEAFARIEPLLACFCASVRHFGPVGAGGRAKLVNNYMVCGLAALVLETFHAAQVAGVDWEKLYDVATRGSGDSGVLRRIAGGAVEGDFRRYVFSVKAAHKDMRYIAEMMRELNLETDMVRAAEDFFRRAEADGQGARMISELLDPDIRAARGV